VKLADGSVPAAAPLGGVARPGSADRSDIRARRTRSNELLR